MRWNAAGTPLYRGFRSPDGVTSSRVYAINNSGIAVGAVNQYSGGLDQGLRAVRWNAAGQVTVLGHLGGSDFSAAYDVNDNRIAVGRAVNADDEFVAASRRSAPFGFLLWERHPSCCGCAGVALAADNSRPAFRRGTIIRMNPDWVYYLWALLLVVGCAFVWLLNLVAMPGNWLIVLAAALFAWLLPADAGPGMTWTAVFVLLALAVAGEIIEFVAGAAGAAKQGASRRAVVLAIVGAVVGSIVGLGIGTPIPILGSLIMAVLGGAVGAFAGAYLGEAWKGRTGAERAAAGRGAFFGRIWGTVGKFAVGAVMLAIVAWDAFL